MHTDIPFLVFVYTQRRLQAGEKPMKRQYFRALTGMLLGLALCFGMAVCPASSEIYYVENEWNYVDGSIDAKHGIPENATGVLERIRRKGVLRVATEPYYAPQEFIDPDLLGQNRFIGADMELARLIAKRMGVELQIVPMEFTQVLPALTDNQVDLTISAISFTPGRASSYTMSKGYYFSEGTATTAFIVRETDKDQYTSMEDLADKTLVAQSSSLQEALVAKHVHSYRQFRRLSSLQSVYEAVRQGKADAGVVDLETAETYIRNNPGAGLALAENLYFVLEEQYLGDRVVAKKGETQLIYFVNGVINEVLEDGIYLKWIEEAQKRADELGM